VEGVAWPPNDREVWFSATRNEAWANAIHSLNVSGKERTLLRLPGILRLWDISRDGQVLLSKESWTTGLQFRGPKDLKERDLSWLDTTIITDLSPDGATLAFEEAGAAARSGVYKAYLRKTDGSAPTELGQEIFLYFLRTVSGYWLAISLSLGSTSCPRVRDKPESSVPME